MDKKEETVKEAEDPFEQYERESDEQSEYFKPQVGERYDIRIKAFVFEKKPFKDGDDPKWTLGISLLSLNDEKTEKTWNTSSRTIIEALKPYRKDQTKLPEIIWRLRRKEEHNKTTYVFEDIGRATSRPLTKEEKVEAFM